MTGHVAGAPVEELLPLVLSGAGIYAVAVRAWLWRLRRGGR